MKITAIPVTYFYMPGNCIRDNHASVPEQAGASQPICLNSQRFLISAPFLIGIPTNTIKMLIIQLSGIC